MSADQRSPQSPADERERSGAESGDPAADRVERTERTERTKRATGVELEFTAPGSTRSRPPVSRTPFEPALPHRIERTKLQARVTALERALETSERRNRQVITQYERLLAERTGEPTRERATDASADAESNPDAGLLRRLLERWR